jgi:hypothetical protein
MPYIFVTNEEKCHFFMRASALRRQQLDKARATRWSRLAVGETLPEPVFENFN